MDIVEFSEVPINRGILEMEESFRVRQNPLSQIRIHSDNEEDDIEDYILLSLLGRMYIREDREDDNEEEDDMDICSSLPVSVATINSFD